MLKRPLFVFLISITLGLGCVVLAGFFGLSYLRDTLEDTFAYTDFHLTYSGALNGEFKGKGYFVSCVGSPLHHEITLFRKPEPGNDIHFSLPVNLTPGIYAFSKSGDPGTAFLASGYLDDENGQYYGFARSDLVSGTIVLDAVPHDSGLPVQGSFSISVYIEKLSDTVSIEGSFDFSSSGDSFYSCYSP